MSGIRMTKSRIIAVILAVAVLLLLFFNWLAVGGDTKKEWNELNYNIDSYVGQIESYGQWIGLDINVKSLARSVKQVLNGKLTPAEMFSISGTARNVVKTVYKAVGRYFISEKDYNAVMRLTGWYRAVFILAVLSILFSIFVRATGKLEKLDFLMIVFVGILFVFTCAISSAISSRGVKLNITVFSILALIFALPLQLIRKIPFLRPEEGDVSSGPLLHSVRLGGIIKKKETFQCSVCGSDIKDGDRFCPACGCEVKDKLSTVVCSTCGSRMPSSANYCENCGTKLEK